MKNESPVFLFLIDSLDDRGQTRFCKNLLVNLFEPGISPCKAKVTDVKIKRQIFEHYLKDICNLIKVYHQPKPPNIQKYEMKSQYFNISPYNSRKFH